MLLHLQHKASYIFINLDQQAELIDEVQEGKRDRTARAEMHQK